MQTKPDKKLLLALTAQGCKRMTSWVIRIDPVHPVTKKRKAEALKQKESWLTKRTVEELLLETSPR